MTGTGLLFTTRILVAATAFGFLILSIVPAAQAISLGGSVGSGSTGGSVGGSVGGGGGANVGASGDDGSGTTGSGSLNIGGGRRSHGNFNLGNGDTSASVNFGPPASSVPGAGSSRSAIARAIENLSPQEQRKLAKKCVSVLAAPRRFDADMVAVCKVLASL